MVKILSLDEPGEHFLLGEQGENLFWANRVDIYFLDEQGEQSFVGRTR